MIGIYKITNLINGKIYIGQSINIEERWKKHCTTHDNCQIHKAIQKYGKENFSFEILEECEEAALNEREIYYIDKYNSFNEGYNMTFGGEGANHPMKLSEDQVDQIIKILKEGKFSEEDIAKLFSVSRNTISAINLGKSRKRKEESYPIRNSFSRAANKEELIELLDKSQGDFNWVSNIYNVSKWTIYNWCKKYGLPTDRKSYGFINEQSYHSKSVICYDINGNIVARYSSIRKAASAIGKNSPSGLAKILREGRKEYAGYLWQYENN